MIYYDVSLRVIRSLLDTNPIVTGRNEVVAKVMFLHVSVILLTGGSPENPPPQDQGEPPPGSRRTPPDQADPPPGPRRTPPRPGRPPPGPRKTPPPQEEHCSIRSMSGRYASYWNAFLYWNFVYFNFMKSWNIIKYLPVCVIKIYINCVQLLCKLRTQCCWTCFFCSTSYMNPKL